MAESRPNGIHRQAKGRRKPARPKSPAGGKAPAGGKIRPLNQPRWVRVHSKDGVPTRVHLNGAWRRVSAILDRWRIDDEWWREPISRVYFSLVLESGAHWTLYHDLIEDRWYRQPG